MCDVHAYCWRNPFSGVNSTIYEYQWFYNILICLDLQQNETKWLSTYLCFFVKHVVDVVLFVQDHTSNLHFLYTRTCG